MTSLALGWLDLFMGWLRVPEEFGEGVVGVGWRFFRWGFRSDLGGLVGVG